MTIEEKLQNILSAAGKIRDMQDGRTVEFFTTGEYAATLAALEVAAAVVELFKDKVRR